MFKTFVSVDKKEKISDDIFLIKFKSKEISQNALPGQFVNIRINDLFSPYLRRPFSICEIENDSFGIIFNTTGSGTKILSRSVKDDAFDCLGPLGKGFNYQDDFTHAIIVAGGMGSAPFPFLTSKLVYKTITTYLGARTKNGLIEYGLSNVKLSTEDGSKGFKGNVIELLKQDLNSLRSNSKIKIFGCGPTPMLKALAKFSLENDLNCEISTECAMACGIGLCQGCNIEANNSDNYHLVCKDGPVFNVKDIKL